MGGALSRRLVRAGSAALILLAGGQSNFFDPRRAGISRPRSSDRPTSYQLALQQTGRYHYRFRGDPEGHEEPDASGDC
jgi:hypothetical protein